jgi:hypothetical protein
MRVIHGVCPSDSFFLNYYSQKNVQKRSSWGYDQGKKYYFFMFWKLGTARVPNTTLNPPSLKQLMLRLCVLWETHRAGRTNTSAVTMIWGKPILTVEVRGKTPLYLYLQPDEPRGLVVTVFYYWSWGPGFDSRFYHGHFSLKGKIPMVTMVRVV